MQMFTNDTDAPFVGGFVNNTQKPIVQAFTGKMKKLEEAAKRLGGKPWTAIYLLIKNPPAAYNALLSQRLNSHLSFVS